MLNWKLPVATVATSHPRKYEHACLASINRKALWQELVEALLKLDINRILLIFLQWHKFVCEKKTLFQLCQQTYFGSFSLCYLISLTQPRPCNQAIIWVLPNSVQCDLNLFKKYLKLKQGLDFNSVSFTPFPPLHHTQGPESTFPAESTWKTFSTRNTEDLKFLRRTYIGDVLGRISTTTTTPPHITYYNF